MFLFKQKQGTRFFAFTLFILLVLPYAHVLGGGDDLSNNLPQEEGPLQSLGQTAQDPSDFTDIYKQVLGMHKYSPLSHEYRFQAELIKNITEHEGSLPHVDYLEFSEVKKMKIDNGASNLGIYSAVYKGRRVVLKVSQFSSTNEDLALNKKLFIRENAALMLVNQIGLGAEYFGMCLTPMGPAIVMEKVSGTNIKVLFGPSGLGNHFSQEMRDKLFDSYVKIFVELILAGITPRDLQIVVDEKGQVKLIDVGQFEAAYFTEDLKELVFARRKLNYEFFIKLLDSYVFAFQGKEYSHRIESTFSYYLKSFGIDLTYQTWRSPLADLHPLEARYRIHLRK